MRPHRRPVQQSAGKPVGVWAEDEHRLGLKPIRRCVWAPVGERPAALGHHRSRDWPLERDHVAGDDHSPSLAGLARHRVGN